jgi:hypothetical protein
MNGNDMIGIAETGSGKTLAFLIPMMIHIQVRLLSVMVGLTHHSDWEGPVGTGAGTDARIDCINHGPSNEYNLIV